MKYGTRDVIASIRNSGGVRVFIPEKLSVNGIKGVRPYYFWRVAVSTQVLMISASAQVTLPLTIATDAVKVSSPFTRDLVEYYRRAAAANMSKVKYRTMVARISNAPIGTAPADTKAAENLRIIATLRGKHVFTES